MALNLVSRQIFAMGGGGFSMEPENLLLNNYISEPVYLGKDT
ncbi:hypothetical protein [Scytonema millei]|nr:hypothetical protein [Scytonema millei]